MPHVALPLPINLEEIDRPRFEKYAHCRLIEQAEVDTLRNVLLTHSGIVLKPPRLVSTSIYLEEGDYVVKEAHKIALYNYFTKPRKRLPDERYLLICSFWCPGYYAWLHNALPRLLRVGDVQEYTLLLPENCRHLVSSLRPFPLKNIVYLKRNRLYRVRKLTLPSAVGSGARLGKATMSGLRDFFHRHLEQRDFSEARYPKRIFISRKGAKVRRILNEAKVLGALAAFGVEAVHLENYDFWEQVALLKNAELVIAPHGAGLSNICFMYPGSVVLELFADIVRPHYRNMYYQIAGLCELHYAYQFCPTESAEPNLYDRSFRVEVPKLLENVAHCLKYLPN